MSLFNLLGLVSILITVIIVVYLKNFKCRHKWTFVEQRSLVDSSGSKIKTNNVSICEHCGCYKNTNVTAR